MPGRRPPPPRHRPASSPAAAGPSAPRPRPAQGPSPSEEGEVVFGYRAALAVFQRRRDAIRRIAFSRAVRAEVEVTALVRWATAAAVPFEELSEGALEGIAGSAQHEGLCVLVAPKPWLSLATFGDALVRTRGAAVALDRVRNPYNVGAILRSAAFFGLEGALLGAPAPHPGIAPTAVRVAEGGTESLGLCRTTDLADSLGRLRARGVQVVGADGQSKVRAVGFPFARPTVLVLGNEREGLAERVRAQCDAVVAIMGSGAVESLNVAVAAGVLIGELVRVTA